MYNLELEVASVDLCKKLKELGYPQDGGGWYWEEDPLEGTGQPRLVMKPNLFVEAKYYKAPTCRELVEWINIGYKNLPSSAVVGYNFSYLPSEIKPNLLAEDLIWLRENGYIKFGD